MVLTNIRWVLVADDVAALDSRVYYASTVDLRSQRHEWQCKAGVVEACPSTLCLPAAHWSAVTGGDACSSGIAGALYSRLFHPPAVIIWSQYNGQCKSGVAYPAHTPQYLALSI